jgi:hypothetical protein
LETAENSTLPSRDVRLVVSDHAGALYSAVMGDLHETLRPQRYFEIGVAQGHTLAIARCESLAVDPAYAISTDVFGQKPVCHLYRATSDEFFARHSPGKILGGPIDLAFLDGMHQYEFLLRDFINTERCCERSSVIVLHDCIPTDVYMARRDPNDRTDELRYPHKDWWAGDVWKALLILRRYRPDLRIHCLDAPPTGLVVITNLDPHSRVLAENYEAAVEQVEGVTLADYGVAKFHADIGLRSTASIWRIGDGSKRLSPGFCL